MVHLYNASVYQLLAMSPDVYTLVTPCSRVCISLIIRVYDSYECTHSMFISKKRNYVCTYPFHTCFAQPHLYSHLFHPPKHVKRRKNTIQ